MTQLSLMFLVVLAWAAVANSWAGTNTYFLQGMFEGKDQIDFIKELASIGVKVFRLSVRYQVLGCDKGTKVTWPVPALELALGEYKDETLDLLDQTLNLIRQHGNGMKVIISPHDGNSLYGCVKVMTGSNARISSSDPYTHYGHSFYTSEEAENYYDNRIRHILDYRGKYTGEVWKDFHEMILAFDVQNEPYAGLRQACGSEVGSDIAAADWVCRRASFMRNSLLGAGNPIKIASGGLGGSDRNGCSFLEGAMQCPELDAVARPGSAQLASDIEHWKSLANGKLLLVEALAIQWRRSDLNVISEFKKATDILNSAGIPWLSSSIIPDPTRSCAKSFESDADLTFIPVTLAKVDFKSAMESATNAEAWQDWGF
ncbi:beta-1,3-mannanase [Trichosporon asahii var. asahii CBS 8904]|uniref:mannan endo-1,4-beta-mannosidase n=1 Tax=Trichosporon asahii var. asahii (strain CBS 8904) TaxID=1220162 RepID=K1VP50_TRIAC|nr:beta-1,3-mannanase [Trichosporon asahii var. asahii CBS 8904]